MIYILHKHNECVDHNLPTTSFFVRILTRFVIQLNHEMHNYGAIFYIRNPFLFYIRQFQNYTCNQ